MRAPSSVRAWIFLWSITVLNLSHSCSEPPWDCLHFSFRTASLKAARRGEAVTQPPVPCPLSPVHQRQAGAWRRAGSGASETFVVQTSHPTEGISEVVLIPADDNLA